LAKQQQPEISPQAEERARGGLLILGSVILAYAALYYNMVHGYLMLFGDAVAHMHVARRILDTRHFSLSLLGGVWLPLPHLVMVPFMQRMEWWHNGLGGAWPSMICYVISVIAFYGICRRLMPERWAWLAVAFYATNPGLLYLSSTAMSEPLFIAITVSSLYLLLRCSDAITSGNLYLSSIWLMAAGLVLICAVYTRYDGWIMAAAGWLMIASWVFRRRERWQSVLGIWFAVFTVLLVLAPLSWFAYNAHFFHDPLDFMRGPYSAQAVEARSAVPGFPPYPALHNMPYGSIYYICAAMMDFAGWSTDPTGAHSGIMISVSLIALAFSVVGLLLALRCWPRFRTALLFLWIPLPFYAYSVAYGAVPIFVPPMTPHGYYHFRYGLELLPALTLSFALAVAALAQWLTARWSSASIWVLRVAFLLVIGNFIVQYIYRPPVLQEALLTSSARIGFEQGIAQTLETLPPDARILMYNSEYVGALQQASIPLQRTIGEFDGAEWQAALADPAHSAPYIIAISGDPVAQAVDAHPQGLEEISITCTPSLAGHPCARFYRSQLYSAH